VNEKTDAGQALTMSDPQPHDIDVDKIATLARIALTEDERSRLHDELGAIVGYIDLLQEVDIDGVEPTAHATRVTNVMRSDDTPPNCMDQAAMLANAPAVHQGDLVRVPQVLTEGGA